MWTGTVLPHSLCTGRPRVYNDPGLLYSLDLMSVTLTFRRRSLSSGRCLDEAETRHSLYFTKALRHRKDYDRYRGEKLAIMLGSWASSVDTSAGGSLSY